MKHDPYAIQSTLPRTPADALPPQYIPRVPEKVPVAKSSEDRQAEKGRWVDGLVALILVTFGGARMASEVQDKTTTDAVAFVQGILWMAVAFFIAAPEISKWVPMDLGFAIRSPLFDRGLLYVVAGLSNLNVAWPAPTSDDAMKVTKIPSYAMAGMLMTIGAVYCVLAGKVYGRMYSLTGLDHNRTFLPHNAPRRGQFDKFTQAQAPYFEAPPLQTPRKLHRPKRRDTEKRYASKTPHPPSSVRSETQLDTQYDRTEYSESSIGSVTNTTDLKFSRFG